MDAMLVGYARFELYVPQSSQADGYNGERGLVSLAEYYGLTVSLGETCPPLGVPSSEVQHPHQGLL